MRFRPGDVVRIENDLGKLDAGDYAVVSAAGAWIRLGRLFEDADGQLIAGGQVADVAACVLSEYARPLGVEAEVD